ncbi:MAG: hypothetical protein NZ700_16495 [Gemmataceae bacterium]|nr:hypothetical protein [Gemmataceae bacterium]MDW8264335.1 hypothetical protein [Gemmataceae bacterium]
MQWKLLIRGLLAFYRRDDGRARENWERLDPARLPSRLVAPLRFLIDKAYAAAQPRKTRSWLSGTAERLVKSPTLTGLRALQRTLRKGQSFRLALRQAEKLLPDLRREAPDLVPRLGACLRGSLISLENHDLVPEYCRVFDPPPDDPHFDRALALLFEETSRERSAIRKWQAYERWLAATPGIFPGDLQRCTRALIWCRMAKLQVLPRVRRPSQTRKSRRSVARALPGTPAHPASDGFALCAQA